MATRTVFYVGRLAALPEREVPTLTPRELEYNAAHVCGRRGYHGDFANTARYDAFGEGWQGTGDCRLCWSTVNVATEQAKRRRAEEIEAAYRERDQQENAA